MGKITYGLSFCCAANTGIVLNEEGCSGKVWKLGMDKAALFEKIAGMCVRKVSDTQIADICGITHDQLLQIKEIAEYREVYSKCAEAYYIDKDLMDQGWDAIENLGMATVIKKLKMTGDPEFALKAAVLANKANRRNIAPGNEPIPARTGQGVVLHLHGNFIERLQIAASAESQHNVPPAAQMIDGIAEVVREPKKKIENGLEDPEDSDVSMQKFVNMLEPGRVERLFGGDGVVMQKDERMQMRQEIDAVFEPVYVKA